VRELLPTIETYAKTAFFAERVTWLFGVAEIGVPVNLVTTLGTLVRDVFQLCTKILGKRVLLLGFCILGK